MFVNQKRINVCEHAVKKASLESFENEPPGRSKEEGKGGGDRGKIERKLSEINNRDVSRGQNEFDVISIVAIL